MSAKRTGFDRNRAHRRSPRSKSAVGLYFLLLGALLLLTVSAPADAQGSAPEAPVTEACGGPIVAGVQRLCGTLNPGGSAKVHYFFAYAVGLSCMGGARTPVMEAEGESVKVSAEASGLAPSTRYTYCLVATNASGETQGEELSFMTLPEAEGPPEAPVTEACGGPVVPGVRRLCGTLNPGGSAKVGYFFAYAAGASCMGGNRTPVGEAEGEGLKVSAEASGLAPSTRYTYCLVATNVSGETPGEELGFMTAGAAPAVDGESAESITQTAVTLQAQINPNNQGTSYAFEYSDNESLTVATIVPGGYIAAGLGDQQVAIPVTSALAPHTTYFYRVTAANATGASVGPLKSFTTPLVPPPTLGGPGGGQAGGIAPVTTHESAPVAPLRATRLTEAQKLAKALKACRKQPRRRRAACERQARRTYVIRAKHGGRSSRRKQ